MGSEKFKKVDELFKATLSNPPYLREAFLRHACGDDQELFLELLALVREHEQAASFPELRVIEGDSKGASATPNPDLERDVYTTIGQYRVLEVLGEGGMGIVYLANQLRPVRRTVALKVLKLGMSSKDAVLRFESEQQALALMNHPYITKVFEAGSTTDGRPYFAMEHVAGEPVSDFCNRARLAVADRLDLFMKVCAAVEHAHQKGVIHRDIKPANVLVVSHPDGPIPKIIDFGVAKSPDHRLTEHTIFTQHGMVVGSYQYMSPEQADPSGFDVDTRTDIYALGVILYELLVGVHPLDLRHETEIGPTETLRVIREQEPIRPSRRLVSKSDKAVAIASERGTTPQRLARTIDGDLDWIVAKAMEKESLRRYPTASAMSADIQCYLNHEAVSAGPPGARYRLRKFVQRNRGLVSSVGAVMLALAVGFVISTGLFVENRRAMELAEEQRDDIMRLSDANRLRVCIEEARDLLPAYPNMIPAMEAWLQGPAAELAGRLVLHREQLFELERRSDAIWTAVDRDVEGISFDDPELQFQYDLLSRLVEDLERFVDPDPRIGQIAHMHWRLELARSIEPQSMVQYDDRWADAIDSIADPGQCPAYGGLRISPQVGLVPIGRDPDSQLWEFGHVLSGEIPQRGPDGQLICRESDGIVLVLIPGGHFLMGATADRAEAAAFGVEPDPEARPNEGPIRERSVDPFFISKYEMTQGQWLRLALRNRSLLTPGSFEYGHMTTLLHPIDNTFWRESDWITRLVGLRLPSEVEWEYTARAGTRTPWYSGKRIEDLATAANLLDQFARLNGMPPAWTFHDWNDGYAETSPVGSYRANSFGLHDAIGNVWEWCVDACADRSSGSSAVPVLADMDVDEMEIQHVARSGAIDHSAEGARVSRRLCFNAGYSHRIGCRPARSIDVPNSFRPQ